MTNDDASEHWKPLSSLRPGSVFRGLDGKRYAKALDPNGNTDNGFVLSLDNGKWTYFGASALVWPMVLGGWTAGDERKMG